MNVRLRRPRTTGAARVVAALVAILGLVGTGCGGRDHAVIVLAASSLTEVLPDALPPTETAGEVTTSFLGSASLATQIEEGRDADLVITANQQTMDRIVATGRVDGSPVTLAKNRLVIAVPPDNPAAIDDLRDLADPDLTIAACAGEVPCGALTRRIADAHNVTLAIDSFDPNVRAVLTRVEQGAVDAGIVYATDATGAEVGIVEIDPHGDFVTPYLMARLHDRGSAQRSTAADALFDHLATHGQDALVAAGFIAP